MRDMISNKQVVHLGNVTISGDTPAASSWVDLRGFDAATLVLINNTITDAGTPTGGFTATLQESDTTAASAATTVPVASTVGGANTIQVLDNDADDSIAGGIGYNGGSRYIRFNVVGTTNSDADVSVVAILNKPHRAETTFVGTKVAAT